MNRVFLVLGAIGAMCLLLGCAGFERQSARDLFMRPTTTLEYIGPEGESSPFYLFPDHPRVNADGHGYFDAVIVTAEDALLIPAKSTAVLSLPAMLPLFGVGAITDNESVLFPFMLPYAGTMGITIGAWYASLPFVYTFDWVAHDIPIWTIQWPMDWLAASDESTSEPLRRWR